MTTQTTFALLQSALVPTESLLRVEYARQLTAQCDKILAELAEDGWDAEKRYGYPSSNMSRLNYCSQKRRYELCHQYTEGTQVSRSFCDPDIRRPRADNAARIAKQADEMAHAALEGYCAKLARKIEATGVEVVSIKYVGGLNPWGWTHVLVNGGEQIWRTKMIINVSCLGKLFNQWPTRQVRSMEDAS